MGIWLGGMGWDGIWGRGSVTQHALGRGGDQEVFEIVTTAPVHHPPVGRLGQAACDAFHSFLNSIVYLHLASPPLAQLCRVM